MRKGADAKTGRRPQPVDARRKTGAPQQSGKQPDTGLLAFWEGQEVELLIREQTDLGYRAIIDNSGEGLLYKNEVFQPLRKGQRIAGFIKKVRDDGRVDLCLQKPGAEAVDALSQKIMIILKAQAGFVAVEDKSPPEVIYRMFGASKKSFKKAVGALYRKRLIIIEPGGIRLSGKEGR